MPENDYNEEVEAAFQADPELDQMRNVLALAAWHYARGSRVMAETYLRTIAHHARALVKHRFTEPREEATT